MDKADEGLETSYKRSEPEFKKENSTKVKMQCDAIVKVISAGQSVIYWPE